MSVVRVYVNASLLIPTRNLFMVSLEPDGSGAIHLPLLLPHRAGRAQCCPEITWDSIQKPYTCIPPQALAKSVYTQILKSSQGT
jgi:hypothetical protein